MNRREAVRLLATGVVLPLAPRGVLAMLRQARSVVNSTTAPRTLNPHQEAIVKTMAEMILPRTDTPGATDVGATEFIDLILTEWYDEAERNRFLSGLADVDARSQSLFGKDFADGSSAQQAEILIALGEKIGPQSERPSVRRREDWPSKKDETFYAMLRRLILTAYYTSEAGATEELHFQVIPDGYDGCAQMTTDKGGPETK